MLNSLTHDPLGLFGPFMGRISAAGGRPDGPDPGAVYFIAADGSAAFVLFESPFGPNETSLNGLLLDMLQHAADDVIAVMPDVDIQFTGSPVIAVGNARSIKHDSIWSVIAAALAIMALLVYVFRDARNISLIFISVGWGWLFAMGAIGLYYDDISIIVVGIASVMLGIAVNYPLHLVDHLSECEDRMDALGQVAVPLVVGNVTTVGAFMCLVPLEAPALHDLGLFSAMLLIGTILFVLVFLPHLVRIRKGGHRYGGGGLIGRLARLMNPGRPHRLWWMLIPTTLVLGYFSFKTGFDPDLRNINYLTDGQKAVFDRLDSTFGGKGGDRRIYVAATGETWDEATALYEQVQNVYKSLPDSVICRDGLPGQMVVSRESQLKRLGRWERLVARRDSLLRAVELSASRHGFSDGAFDPFVEMMSRSYHTVGEEEMEPVTGTLLSRNVSVSDGRYAIADIVELNDMADREAVMSCLRSHVPEGVIVFDVKGMGNAMTGALADDFNYIGLMCGFIVFVFLWLSMGRIELAIVSFVPMAVSWIWILGIMGMAGLQFNIVNVILATFIFGQGDDYTIFVTEGLTYEYGVGRRIVERFKSSIIVSALMMFAGIGVLVFAEHPAMRSLGQVAVIGMFTVVVMACVIPPALFRFLTCDGTGVYRLRPVTLKSLVCNLWWRVSRHVGTCIPGVRIDIVEVGSKSYGAAPVGAVERNVYIDSYIERYVAGKGYGGDIMIIGSDMLMSRSDRWYVPGHVTVLTGADESVYRSVREDFVRLDDVCALVRDRYLYKGAGVWRNACREIEAIRSHGIDAYLVDSDVDRIEIDDPGQGERAIVTAILNPGVKVVARLKDAESEALARGACNGLDVNVFCEVRK
ncbi:MAG: MMPL family transporter, partial [Muribaculaceae bacterium]|nr:MMPL family transporter [Muribaculaceae bacterium]